MIQRRFLAVLLVPLLLALAARAEDFWVKKPYTAWSAEETRKLLEDSPWARSITLNNVVMSNQTVADVERETPIITYRMQLRSALPVRQAIVRAQQLQAHYDAMSAEQKKQFDQSSERWLAANFDDRIIAYVTCSANVQGYRGELRQYWN